MLYRVDGRETNVEEEMVEAAGPSPFLSVHQCVVTVMAQPMQAFERRVDVEVTKLVYRLSVYADYEIP